MTGSMGFANYAQFSEPFRKAIFHSVSTTSRQPYGVIDSVSDPVH